MNPSWNRALKTHHNKPNTAAVNSPHSGQSRCCPGATGGIPRISPGPCWAAGGVTRHLLPEDTAAEYQNGTPTPEPKWGRFDSQVVAARPHSDWGGRRAGPVCSQARESNRLNSATSCQQTHVENNHKHTGVRWVVYVLSHVVSCPWFAYPFTILLTLYLAVRCLLASLTTGSNCVESDNCLERLQKTTAQARGFTSLFFRFR